MALQSGWRFKVSESQELSPYQKELLETFNKTVTRLMKKKYRGKMVIDFYVKTAGGTSIAAERRKAEGFFEKFIQGKGIDIGHGGDAIVEGFDLWDWQEGDAA